MKLVVALDMKSTEENLKLAKELAGYDLWLKVGFRSYIRDGRYLLDNLKGIDPDFKIFLDLKLYDIPNTMADAAEEIAELGVDMFNIHASAGEEAMSAVMQRVAKFKKRPKVLAVTALTSFDNDEFAAIYGSSIDKKALEFAVAAHRCSLDGVVCSAHESLQIKQATGESFLTLTPGIRPFFESADDQKRVANLELASEREVDFVVVGRAIYEHEDPTTKVKQIEEKIDELTR